MFGLRTARESVFFGLFSCGKENQTFGHIAYICWGDACPERSYLVVEKIKQVNDDHPKEELFEMEFKTIPPIRVREVSAEEFHKYFVTNRHRIRDYSRWKTDSYSLEEFEQMEKEGAKFYLTEKNSTLAVKSNGEMISLLKGEDKHEDLHPFMAYVEKCGGKYFTCYDSNEDFFKECGCIRIKTDPWNEELAPSDWKPEYKTESVDSFITKEESVRIIELLKDKFKLKGELSEEDMVELYPLVCEYEQLRGSFSTHLPTMDEILANADKIVDTQKDISRVVKEINARDPLQQDKNIGIGD